MQECMHSLAMIKHKLLNRLVTVHSGYLYVISLSKIDFIMLSIHINHLKNYSSQLHTAVHITYSSNGKIVR